MDTQVAPENTLELHTELERASEKLAKRNERAFTSIGFGATTGGLQLTRDYIDQTIEAVKADLLRRPVGGTKEAEMFRLLLKIDPDVIGLALLQTGLHSIALSHTLRDTNIAIAGALYREAFIRNLLITDRSLGHKVNKMARVSGGTVSKRMATAKRLAIKEGFRMAEWSSVTQQHIGQWGTNVLLEALPDVFCIAEVRPGKHVEHALCITADAMERANEAVSQAILHNPVYQPRAAKPAPWASYAAAVAEDPRTSCRVSILRTFHADLKSATHHAIRTGSMQPALDGLNALQEVPWRINGWMLSVIQRCYDMRLPIKGLPNPEPIALPERVTDEEWRVMPLDVRIMRRRELLALKAINNGKRSECVSFREDMGIAGNMYDLPCFYVPMNCDWRGRVYGLAHFNFAREDRVRSLFMFANGEPIGTEGLEWLKVHVANCGDFDKISKRPIEERIAWTNENLGTLTEYVTAPFAHMGWTKADKPFLFLAACRELVRALNSGPTYVASLPVSFDGSCSGLQHLCAMTRAPEGQLVNLTDNAVPADVYQTVADRVKAAIEADEENPDLAKTCLDYGVDRSLVKRNVMTFSYSSKEFGMGQQHIEDTMEPLKLKVLKKTLEVHPFGDDEGYTAAKYLAKHTYAAIKDTVRLPAEAMAFMQALARALAHESKPLRWVSPAGIPWINRYHEKTTERVELWLNDNGVKVKTRIKVATGQDTRTIAKEKVSAGVAPNLVHACDAAHLLLTVRACAEEGITNIATVHDSFGCLPSQATRLNAILREQFLKMYTDHDVLAELRKSALADLTPANWDKVPPLPAKGSLNLEEVLNAKYAFA